MVGLYYHYGVNLHCNMRYHGRRYSVVHSLAIVNYFNFLGEIDVGRGPDRD